MNERSGVSIAELEHQLDGASALLSAVRSLDPEQASRVAERMDRLASQLMEVSAPPAMTAVHERLGTVPAAGDDLAALAAEMGPADSEG